MSIKFAGVKAGDTLYAYYSERAGNTTMRRWSNWKVQVISIDHEKGTAVVSKNGNPRQTYYKHEIERLRRKPGKERDPWDRHR